jgi:hypothetical protein
MYEHSIGTDHWTSDKNYRPLSHQSRLVFKNSPSLLLITYLEKINFLRTLQIEELIILVAPKQTTNIRN